MNLLLDAKTIFITLGMGHLFTLILISAYRRSLARDETLAFFYCAKAAQAAAWFLQAFREVTPSILSLSIPNSLLFIGATLEILALLNLQNALRRGTKKLYFVLAVCCIACFHLILLFFNSEHLRIAFASLATLALLIPIIRMIKGNAANFLMKIITYLYLFVIVTSVIRGVAALLFPNSASLFDPGVYSTIAFLSLYLVMVIGNTGFVLLWKDKADRELVRLASYDDLTGALNRATFSAQAKTHIAVCASRVQPLSYLLFDIDKFKSINDTYGHAAGDQILQDLATRIREILGPNELFVRYGGDEFGILMPGMDAEQSDLLAERIRRSPDEAVHRGLPTAYTISIGVLTAYPDRQTQLETLYTHCDKSLYAAKRAGRNRINRSSGQDAAKA